MQSINPNWTDKDNTTLDFIVVGAGAGGAPLAARLAERGYQVLVIEMGPRKPAPREGAVVDCTDVPLLHTESTEDPRHSLRFFVDHFGGDDEERNPRRHHYNEDEFVAENPPDEEGVFYPRSQGIGGCTIHNAMITICGPSDDWDDIAKEVMDPSWRGDRMRVYFERLEKCNYAKSGYLQSLISFLRGSPSWGSSRHGTDGWLETSLASLRSLIDEKKFLKIVSGAAVAALDSGIETLAELKWGTFTQLDPNHWETMRRSQEGLSQIPLSVTRTGERSSPRERLLAAQLQHGDYLHTVTDAFVTKIIFENLPDGEDQPADRQSGYGNSGQPIATGVQVLQQPHVYQADAQAVPPPEDWESQVQSLYCNREVILCGGSFNTPQLLMLSGVGNREQLKSHGLPVVQHSPAVGNYLQDRYEVPITIRLSDRFRTLDQLELSSHAGSDPFLRRWINDRGLDQKTNPYATNGGLIGLFKRSKHEDKIPDLFMFALAGYFPGYHTGYSTAGQLAPDAAPGNFNSVEKRDAAEHKRWLTWLILKARSRNDTGTLKLRDRNPFRRPYIDFNVFPDDAPGSAKDLDALYEGFQFLQQMVQQGIANGLIESVHFQTTDPPLDTQKEESVKRWLKQVAWGHHACGTCRMGTSASNSVVDSRFRVHGVKGLRVVDASIFPKIPGYFIVSNVYMISEKAADVLSEDHDDHFYKAPIESNATIQEHLRKSPVFHSTTSAKSRERFPTAMEHREAELIEIRRKRANHE